MRWIPGRTSLRSSSSYASAFAGDAHPCQSRAGTRAAAHDRAPAGIVGRDADRDSGEHRDVRGNAEQLAHLLLALAHEAVDAGGETLVDRGEEDQHERRAGIDVPVRHRPFDLLAVLELVGLSIAIVVVVFARANEDVRGGRCEPRLHALMSDSVLAADGGQTLLGRGVGEDDQTLPLAVAAA